MHSKIKFDSVNPSVSWKDILTFEEKLGFKLPEDYKNFLTLNNGGEASFGQQIGNHEGVYLSEVHPIESGKNELMSPSILYFRETHTEAGILPSNLIEIIRCYFPHQVIVMSLDVSALGSIYLWDNQAPFDHDDVSKLADTFTEFLGLIHMT